MTASKRIYTGVGSRETPSDVLVLMRRIGYVMAMKGFSLRTGEAPGADTAFYTGLCDAYDLHRVQTNNEVYLAGTPSPIHFIHDVIKPRERLEMMGRKLHNPNYADAVLNSAMETARRIRGGFYGLNDYGIKCHTRNIFQVSGLDMNTPSSGLICWAKPVNIIKHTDKIAKFVEGGTNTAYAYAKILGIPVYNLHDMEDRMYFENWVNQELDKLSKGA